MKNTKRLCMACRKFFSLTLRLQELLGHEFFIYLRVDALVGEQLKDIEFRSKFCCDECSTSYRVRKALEKMA